MKEGTGEKGKGSDRRSEWWRKRMNRCKKKERERETVDTEEAEIPED